MSDENTVPATETPSEEVQATPAAEQQDAQPEQQQEPKQETKPEDQPKTPKWFRQTLARKDQQLGELRARLRMLEEAMRAPSKSSADEGPQQSQQVDQGDIEQRVLMAAQRIAQQERVAERFRKDVLIEGSKADPAFAQKLHDLAAVGDWDESTMEMMLDAEKPAALFAHLASNLDEAAEILALPLVQRARAIARLELRLEQQSKTAASNAPRPLTPIRAGAGSGKVDPEKMNDAEWSIWRREQQLLKRKK